MKTDEAGNRVMTEKPKFVALDITVDGKHEYRIQNVAVRRMYIGELVLASPGVAGRWILNLHLLDGIQLTIKGEEFVLRVQMWGADR